MIRGAYNSWLKEYFNDWFGESIARFSDIFDYVKGITNTINLKSESITQWGLYL